MKYKKGRRSEKVKWSIWAKWEIAKWNRKRVKVKSNGSEIEGKAREVMCAVELMV